MFFSLASLETTKKTFCLFFLFFFLIFLGKYDGENIVLTLKLFIFSKSFEHFVEFVTTFDYLL